MRRSWPVSELSGSKVKLIGGKLSKESWKKLKHTLMHVNAIFKQSYVHIEICVLFFWKHIHVSVYWRHQHVISGYDHLYSRKDRRSSEHETCVEWHSKVLDVIGDMICHTFPDIWHWWRLITSYCSCCGNVSEMFTSLFSLESSKGDLCWQTCEVTVHLMAKFDLNFTLGFSNIYLREPMEEQHGAL